MELVFPQPIAVRSVHLYNPNTTSEVDVHVHEARVRLFADLATQQEVATAMSGDLTSTGTAMPFEDLAARVVRIEILDVTGQFEGQTVASLGEVEVISKGLPASIVISPIHQPFSIRPVLEGSALSWEWDTQEGWKYRLEHTATLPASLWKPLEETVGDGSIHRKSLAATMPAGLYRVRAVLPPP